jgi:L-ascorbate metabolism protein UlaG (beta-lactamase superfamily)
VAINFTPAQRPMVSSDHGGCAASHRATGLSSNSRDLVRQGGRRDIVELGWNDTWVCRSAKGELHLTAFEVKHWGRRWPSKLPRGYNGYLLHREGKSIIFGGDTALTRHFAELRSRGPFEVAIMPIGSYTPWIRNHCTPEQAVTMANEAGARYRVPIHHLTFRLSEEPFAEPMERLQAALQHEPDRIALARVGETFVCPRT